MKILSVQASAVLVVLASSALLAAVLGGTIMMFLGPPVVVQVVTEKRDGRQGQTSSTSTLRRSTRVNMQRQLLSTDPRSVKIKSKNEHFDDFLKAEYQPEVPTKIYNLPNDEWCRPSRLPPINYDKCNTSTFLNAVPLRGGLTNGLKMILLSVIRSIEDDNSCFFIEEKNTVFPKELGPFLENFFEPIGLSATSLAVQGAGRQKRIRLLRWQAVWSQLRKRRVEGTVHTLDALGYKDAEGHDLKRNMLRRVWRPLPTVRDATCSQLESHIHGEEYIALSIRQGDKSTEGFTFATVDQYVDQVEEIVPTHFGGKVPLIFVATDDCEPLQELRKVRPNWRFVSECDRLEQHGFVLQDHTKWSRAELDNHYAKFFVELFAMAGSKVWIGVAYTNVSWWVYFMRQKTEDKTFFLLDTKGSGSKAAPMMW